jgi:hypothetical protein
VARFGLIGRLGVGVVGLLLAGGARALEFVSYSVPVSSSVSADFEMPLGDIEAIGSAQSVVTPVLPNFDPALGDPVEWVFTLAIDITLDGEATATNPGGGTATLPFGVAMGKITLSHGFSPVVFDENLLLACSEPASCVATNQLNQSISPVRPGSAGLPNAPALTITSDLAVGVFPFGSPDIEVIGSGNLDWSGTLTLGYFYNPIVPEPGTALLIGLGCVALAMRRTCN